MKSKKNLKILSVILIMSTLLFTANACRDNAVSETLQPQNSVLSAEKDILKISVNYLPLKIDEKNASIDIIVPSGLSDLKFKTEVQLSPNAKLSTLPDNGIIDYNKLTVFVITAQDGSVKRYAINLIRQDGFISAKIKNNMFGYEDGIVDVLNKTIIFNVDKDILKIYKSTVDREPMILDFKVTDGYAYQMLSGANGIKEFEWAYDVNLMKKDGTIDQYKVIFKNKNTLIEIGLQYNNKYPYAFEDAWTNEAMYVPSGLTEGLKGQDLVMRIHETEDISNRVPLVRPVINSVVTPGIYSAQNFTQDISYMVAAESGHTIERKVRVIRAKLVISGERGVGGIIIRRIQDKTQYFFHYLSKSKITKLKFVDVKTKHEFEPSFQFTHDGLYGTVSYDIAPYKLVSYGRYKLFATLESGEVIETFYNIDA
jgi:hypothetical protein